MSLPVLPEEDSLSLWVSDWQIWSPLGMIDTIACVDDSMPATVACRAHGVSIIMLPQFRLQSTPSLILISRKPPWHDRAEECVRESDHPGVWNWFYANARGRFMRVNDAYRHATYQLRRAAFIELPLMFPERDPDLDIGWMPQETYRVYQQGDTTGSV
jgi:hypothetical protein